MPADTTEEEVIDFDVGGYTNSDTSLDTSVGGYMGSDTSCVGRSTALDTPVVASVGASVGASVAVPQPASTPSVAVAAVGSHSVPWFLPSY